MKDNKNKRDIRDLELSLENLKKEDWYKKEIKNYLKYLSKK